MAGDWIQIRVLIASDPQVVAMADYLQRQDAFMDWLLPERVTLCVTLRNVTRYVLGVTVNALIRVWGVANDRGERYDDDLIMRYARYSTICEIAGGVPCFGEAMAYVGWAVEEIDNGAELVRFPRFMKNNTPASERHKVSNAERQKRYRERNKTVTPEVTLRVTRSNVTRNARKRNESNGREEKRREDIDASASISPLPPKGDLPFDTEAFASAWTDWEQHHKEKKKPITPTARKGQLAKLKEMGHDRAIACLRHSTAQGWQGLYEPDRSRNGSVPSAHRQRKRANEYPEPDYPLPLIEP